MPIYQNKDWLLEEYVNQRQPTTTLARKANRDVSTICYWLKKQGIPLRSPGETLQGRRWTEEQKRSLREKRKQPERIVVSPEWLHYHYEVLSETTYEIAARIGCAPTCIQAKLKKLGIKSKHGLRKKNVPESLRKRQAEAWKGSRNPMYGSHRIGNANPMYGRRGPDNPQWRGGRSFEPYCPHFNQALKESVRDEFGRRCFLCGKDEKSNCRRHHIHHVDYNKGQGCGQRWSLVPLCGSCHGKTNKNRWHWFNLMANYWVMDLEINANGVYFPD